MLRALGRTFRGSHQGASSDIPWAEGTPVDRWRPATHAALRQVDLFMRSAGALGIVPPWRWARRRGISLTWARVVWAKRIVFGEAPSSQNDGRAFGASPGRSATILALRLSEGPDVGASPERSASIRAPRLFRRRSATSENPRKRRFAIRWPYAGASLALRRRSAIFKDQAVFDREWRYARSAIQEWRFAGPGALRRTCAASPRPPCTWQVAHNASSVL
jgi:hypothetical protein